MPRLSLLCLAVWMVVPTGNARAAVAGNSRPTPDETLAVFAVPLKDDEATQAAAGAVEQRLGEALRHAGATLVNLEEQFPPPALESTSEGAWLQEQARKAYDRLDPDAAIASAHRLVSFYLTHPRETKPATLAQAFVARGAAHLLGERPNDAEADFERALLTDSSVEPDSDLFGQEVRVSFDAARATFSARPSGTLSLDSTPSGAQVLSHTQSRGRTPLSDLSLRPGRHQLVLTAPGYLPQPLYVVVPEGQKVSLQSSLEPHPDYASVIGKARLLTSPFLGDRTVSTEAIAVASALGARFVTVAKVAQAEPQAPVEVEVWDVQQGARLRGLRLLPGDAQSFVRAASEIALWAGLAEPPPEPSLWARVSGKWWFWAAVGGVAAATTAGVLIGTGTVELNP